MKTHQFSDPELYLLNNWANAMLLERSMTAVRVKYAEILGVALEKVSKHHDGLDSRFIETKDKEKFKVGIGKRSWPSMYPKTWPSGFWLGCIGLRHLTSEDGDAPYACIWLNPPRSADLDLKVAVQRLHDAAQTILSQEQLPDLGKTVKVDEADIWYPLGEPRAKLLEMILNNKSRELIACIVAHFETMAKFIPVMDEIVGASK
jgi:hypothetical protein